MHVFCFYSNESLVLNIIIYIKLSISISNVCAFFYHLLLKRIRIRREILIKRNNYIYFEREYGYIYLFKNNKMIKSPYNQKWNE